MSHWHWIAIVALVVTAYMARYDIATVATDSAVVGYRLDRFTGEIAVCAGISCGPASPRQ